MKGLFSQVSVLFSVAFLEFNVFIDIFAEVFFWKENLELFSVADLVQFFDESVILFFDFELLFDLVWGWVGGEELIIVKADSGGGFFGDLVDFIKVDLVDMLTLEFVEFATVQDVVFHNLRLNN